MYWPYLGDWRLIIENGWCGEETHLFLSLKICLWPSKTLKRISHQHQKQETLVCEAKKPLEVVTVERKTEFCIKSMDQRPLETHRLIPVKAPMMLAKKRPNKTKTLWILWKILFSCEESTNKQGTTPSRWFVSPKPPRWFFVKRSACLGLFWIQGMQDEDVRQTDVLFLLPNVGNASSGNLYLHLGSIVWVNCKVNICYMEHMSWMLSK